MASVTAKVFQDIVEENDEEQTNYMYLFICFLIILTIIMFIRKLIAKFYHRHDHSYEAKLE